ncbi:MAG: hypothetical protein ACM3Q2_05035 [Syntrophothermus sp.]
MDSFSEIIKYVLSIEPELTATGISTKYTYDEDPLPEDEFYLCLKWLEEQKITKQVQMRSTSYTYKHDVEAWHKETFGRH